MATKKNIAWLEAGIMLLLSAALAAYLRLF